jgi:hypothetical protein
VPPDEIAVEPSKSLLVEAERRPLVTYSDGADRAWARKMEGDILPETREPRRLPMVAASMAALFFLAAFFGGREAAVATVPDLAGLYAALGLPVNLEGLAIESVTAERTSSADGARLIVSGSIRNLGAAERTLPPLAAVIYDSAMVPAGARGFEPPSPRLGAGEETAFLLELDRVPGEAAEVAVRFGRPGENLPAVAKEPADAGAADPGHD